jgi:hypothetical protein
MKKFLLGLFYLFLIIPSLHASWQNRFAPLAELDTEAAIEPPKERVHYTRDQLINIRDQMKVQGIDNKPEGYEGFPRAIKKTAQQRHHHSYRGRGGHYHASKGRGGHHHSHYNRPFSKRGYGRNSHVPASHQEERKEFKAPKVEPDQKAEKSYEQKKSGHRFHQPKRIWVPKKKEDI